MSSQKRIITGPSGAGKTHAILEDLFRHLVSKKQTTPFYSSKILIVPYGEQAKRLSSLLLRKFETPALFRSPVMSLSQFLRDYFPSLRGRDLSEVQRRLILGEILESLPLAYYENARRLHGFISSLSSFISEWKGLLLGEKDFDRAFGAFKKPASLEALKLQDLRAIYSGYQHRLQSLGFTDFDDSLQKIFSEPEHWSRLADIETLCFDGFYDFSPLQIQLIKGLSARISEISVYLTHEDGGRSDLFAITRATAQKLERIGFKKEVFDSKKNYRAEPWELVLLEEKLFSGDAASDTAVKHIQIFESVGLRSEMVEIARELVHLRKSSRYDWSDFAVLIRNLGEYRAISEEVFQEYEIPAAIHERKRLRENAWVRHFLEGLRSLAVSFSEHETFFHFLKSSYLDDSKAAVFSFEKFAASLGFWQSADGLVEILLKWLTTEKPEGAEKLAGFIKELLEKSKSWLSSFSLDQFQKFCEKSLMEWGYFTGETLASTSSREDYRAYRQLEKILTEIRLNQTIRQREYSFPEFLESLEKGIDLGLFSGPPAPQDAVQVYSVQMARQKEFKVVFLAGLLQKNFPGIVKEDTILKDSERRALKDLGFEERLARSHHERYYFYLALTRARERIYLSYPRFDLEGKESLPSFFVEEVRKVFKQAIPTLSEERSLSIPKPERAVSLRELENYLAFELGERDLAARLKKKGPAVRSLYEFLIHKKVISKIVPPSLAGGLDVAFHKKELKEKFSKKNKFSSTSLEAYGGCPFRYYASKELKLIEPEKNELILLEGTIFHELLCAYLEKAIHDQLDLEELRCAIEEALNKKWGLFASPAEKTLLKDIFQRHLLRIFENEKERLASSPYQPRLFEKSASFGKKDSPRGALVIRSEKGSFELAGEMDRVDVDEAAQKAVIIDYKTGKTRAFKKKEVEEGKHLQLPLYAEALRQLFDLVPAGFLIYSIKSAKESGLAGGDKDLVEVQRLIEAALEYAKQYAAAIRKAQFPVDPKECPNFCSFGGVCRFEKWRKIYLEDSDD